MKILTVGEQTAVEAQVASVVTREDAVVDLSLVNVLIEYPEDYKGQRHHINGKVYPMSKETAEIAVAKGIGSIEGTTEILDASTEDAANTENEETNTNDESKDSLDADGSDSEEKEEPAADTVSESTEASEEKVSEVSTEAKASTEDAVAKKGKRKTN